MPRTTLIHTRSPSVLGTIGDHPRPSGGRGSTPLAPWARPVLFPAAYLTLVLLGAMDVVMTRILLSQGWSEANSLAAHVIRDFDVAGMAALKFASMSVALVICEYVGRRRPGTGRALARVCVAVALTPIAAAAAQVMSNFDDLRRAGMLGW